MKIPFLPFVCRAAALALACFPGTSQAVLVFYSDFTTDPTPTFALAPSGTNVVEMSTAGPGGSRAIRVLDTSTSNGGSALLDMDSLPAFNTALAGQNEFRINADFAVTSLGSATLNTNSLPRLLLRSTNTAGTINTAQSMTLGFGRTTGDALVLYASRTENAAPNHASAVILATFGTYSATAADNDTDDAYVSLSISYLQGSGQFNISAFNGATLLGSGSVTGFDTGLSFTETTTSFLVAAGNNSTSEAYLDNVRIETIPEPSLTLLGVAGAVALTTRRRRR